MRRTFLRCLSFASVVLLCYSTAYAAPQPEVTIGLEPTVLLNQVVNVDLALRNASTTAGETGFYPVIEVILPNGLECAGGCPGLAVTSPGGAPADFVLFGGNGIGASTYTNPITGEQISLAANETLIIISAPVGTLAVGQPAVEFRIPATMTANAAVGTPLTVDARAIFVLGSQANGVRGACGAPGVDTLCQTTQMANVTPTAVIFEKEIATTLATATGPNYPRNFTLTADVATSVTVTDVVIADTLPDELVITGPAINPDCTGNPGFVISPAPSACTFTYDANGGGSFSATYASLLGIAGDDVTISYEAFVQENVNAVGAPVIDPVSGAPTNSQNIATLDHTLGAIPQSQQTQQVSVAQRSFDIQKSFSVTDNAPAGNSPGDVVTWRVSLFVSDYFSLDAIDFDDDIRDGQTYVPNSFAVRVDEGVDTVELNASRTNEAVFGAYLLVGAEINGETHIDFDISGALSDPVVFNRDAILVGNAAGAGVPTRVTITYQTVIDEEFAVVSGVGETTTIDAGDEIVNDSAAVATVSGEIIPIPVLASATVEIPPLSTANKQTAFKNGAAPPMPVTIAYLDEITYKLTVVVPTGDVEDFKIQDYLPTPLFSATDPDADGLGETFIQDPQGDTAPAAGHWRFTSTSYIPPSAITVVQQAADNSITFDFDDIIEDNGASATLTIELLFTVTATNAPIANGLKLVNVANIEHANSRTETTTNTLSEIADLVTESPQLRLAKSAGSVISGGGSLSGGNFVNVDANDELSFQISLENTGAETAFDVRVTDVLPTGLEPPTGGWTYPGNVAIIDGGGMAPCTVASFVLDGTAPAGTFRLIDGEIDAGAICLISLPVQVSSTVALHTTITNSATTTYAKQVGGPTYSPETETATVRFDAPVVTKQFLNGTSSDASTLDPAIRPGETVNFRISVTLPEGELATFRLQELDINTGNPASDFFGNFSVATIAFPAAVENACSSGNMALFNFVGAPDVCFTNNPTLVANQTQVNATTYQVNFGTVTNFNTDDSAAETIEMVVTATFSGGKPAGAYINRGRLVWSGTSVTGSANFTGVVPALSITKSSLTMGEVAIGETIDYRVNVQNTGSSKAYDITDIEDTLPTGLGNASLLSSTYQATNVGSTLGQVGQLVSISVRDLTANPDILNGELFRAEYRTTVLGTMVSDSTAGPGHPAAPGGMPNGSLIDGPGCVNSLVNSADIDQFNTGDAGSGVVVTSIANSAASQALDSDNDGIPNSVETVGTTCPDSDGDGIPDHLDTDSDDNGIPDSTEYDSGADSDGDGTPDYRDTDDDNDGRSDWDEIQDVGGDSTTDSDGDGVPDYLDPDSDDDGIPDSLEGNVDTDGDGLVDRLDPDSDDDGIPDWFEAGNPAPTGVDTDNDGIDDAFDADEGGAGLNANPTDTDSDGVDDFRDLDSDNDGLSDHFEAGNPVPSGTDTDSDGIDDAYDTDQSGAGLNAMPTDTDGDMIPDFREVDSDADGIQDYIEADTGTPTNTDSDGDGIDNAYDVDLGESGLLNTATDTDGDGRPDFRDLDSDNDGLGDLLEGVVDTDSDGRPDYRDLDSDNDGTPDYIEAGNPPATGLDTDNDGIDNAYDTDQGGAGLNTMPTDTDGDMIPDFREVDADNDGVEDYRENGLPMPTGNDTDNDGIDDAFDPDQGGAGLDTTPVDTDGDGVADYQDLDADNDGIADSAEGSADADRDGIPNYLDIDSDNDGITDFVEAGNPAPSGNDLDGDGIDDAYDTDQGGAGLVTMPNDTDMDSRPDFLDIDADGDGITDIVEAQATSGFIAPSGVDANNNGLDDAYDAAEGGTTIVPIQTDSDMIPDYLDTDSDGDSILDAIEGHDANADGVADSIPLGADTDGDGLDDVYDTYDLSSPPSSGTNAQGSNAPLPNFDGVDDRDWRDTDDDNDGILTADEGPLGDTDGDGQPDYLEADSDNDGIPDSVECPMGSPCVDSDGDSIPDVLDPDSDNDGILDRDETDEDFDNDGIPNYLDLDSDNDGIVDLVEGGGTDVDGNGRVDNTADTDSDGIVDLFDTDNGGTPLPVPNTDGTCGSDFLDIDADDDGIVDIVEAQGEMGFISPQGVDSDSDGIDDAYDPDASGTPLVPVNTDGSGAPDYQDTDSDDDGVSDFIEGSDANFDGAADVTRTGTDSDGDGLDDAFDTAVSTSPTNSLGSNAPLQNFDSDLSRDWRDTDDDNDTIPTSVEGSGDTDGDGRPDRYDLDSDDDGISDENEGSGDNDGDGIPDFQTPRFSLRSAFYFVWNGFLDQVNVGALFNKSEVDTAMVTITLLDIEGNTLSQQGLTLAPRQQFDFLINGLPGFSADTYGMVRVDFSPANTIEGYTGLYRFGEDGQEVEFAMIKEHQNSLKGTSYAVFNTYQPSRKPSEQDNVVIHWLQLANHDQDFWQEFTINRYDFDGSLIDSRRVSIPPQGRRDVQAGHEDDAERRVGLVEVVPGDPSKPYGGELFRYGGDSVRNIFPSTYSFGIAAKLEQGEARTQLTSVSRGAGGLNFLELVNTSAMPETALVHIVRDTGETLFSGAVALPAHGQVHLDLNVLLEDGQVGYAQVRSQGGNPLMVNSSVYFYEADGRVATAYSASARRPLLDRGFSGYNAFFAQQNWLKLFNSGSSQTTVQITAFDIGGAPIGTTSVVLGAGRGLDVELETSLGFDLGSDTYGGVKVESSLRNALSADFVRVKESGFGNYRDLVKQLPVR